jgi:hypothetical protein
MCAAVLILRCPKENKLLACCVVVIQQLKSLTCIGALTEPSATCAKSTPKQAAFKTNLAAASHLCYWFSRKRYSIEKHAQNQRLSTQSSAKMGSSWTLRAPQRRLPAVQHSTDCSKDVASLIIAAKRDLSSIVGMLQSVWSSRGSTAGSYGVSARSSSQINAQLRRVQAKISSRRSAFLRRNGSWIWLKPLVQPRRLSRWFGLQYS